jgi:COMPASS component SWD3
MHLKSQLHHIVLHFLSVLQGECTHILEGHTNYVMCVDYNPKLDVVATGSYDESVRIWSAKDGKCLKTLPAHSDPVTSVHFHPTGTLLLTAGFDGVM